MGSFVRLPIKTILRGANKQVGPLITYEGQSKVRGHSQLRSHLLNAFKSYFIFRKGWFHSLNNANIKKISAVVPKVTELGYTWGNLSVPRQF